MDTTEGGIGLPNEMEQANDEIDRLRTELAAVTAQRDAAAAVAVKNRLAAAPGSLTEGEAVLSVRGRLGATVDPAEAARLGRLVFDDPAPPAVDAVAAFEAIRAAGAGDWDAIADPEGFLGRGGEGEGKGDEPTR